MTWFKVKTKTQTTTKKESAENGQGHLLSDWCVPGFQFGNLFTWSHVSLTVELRIDVTYCWRWGQVELHICSRSWNLQVRTLDSKSRLIPSSIFYVGTWVSHKQSLLYQLQCQDTQGEQEVEPDHREGGVRSCGCKWGNAVSADPPPSLVVTAVLLPWSF